MNDLEQWLADVKLFNAHAKELELMGKDSAAERIKIIVDGRACGLTVAKIKSMLASVKLKVEMPGGGDAPKV